MAFYNKKPLTFTEQYELLTVERKLIDDLDNLEAVLSNINYFRYTGFLYKYKVKGAKPEKYSDGTCTSLIKKEYLMDLELREICMESVQHAEIALRTFLAYTHSIIYGSLGYMNNENFVKNYNHVTLMNKLSNRISDKSYLKYVAHSNQVYNGELAIWKAVELFTLEELIDMHSHLHKKAQNFIESRLICIGSSDFNSNMQKLKDLRNDCAHHQRINDCYRKELATPDKLKHLLKFTTQDSLFFYICYCKFMSRHSFCWQKTIDKIDIFLKDYSDVINKSTVGFPDNWKLLLENL